MDWTPELKVKYLLGLNWTVTAEQDPDEGYTIVRVAELPSVIATGNPGDTTALEKDFWEALQASLEAALEFGDSIQLPKGVKAPWDRPAAPTPARNVIVQSGAPLDAYVPHPRQTGGSPAPAAYERVPAVA